MSSNNLYHYKQCNPFIPEGTKMPTNSLNTLVQAHQKSILIGGFEEGRIPTPEEFYSPFIMGFEIECIHPQYDIVREHLANRMQQETGVICNITHTGIGCTHWCVGSDGSLGAGGLEIRTPPNPPLQDIKKIMDFLHKERIYLHTNCGGHIHISHPTQPIGMDIKETMKYWGRRAGYANGNLPGGRGKSCAVRVVDTEQKHLEVRAFNSTLGFRTWIARLMFVKNHVTIGNKTIKCHSLKQLGLSKRPKFVANY